ADLYGCLARLQLESGRVDESRASIVRALEARTRGIEHATLAEGEELMTLAAIDLSTKKQSEADAGFAAAMEIFERRLSNNPVEYCRKVCFMASIHHELGYVDAAEQLYRHVLEVLQSPTPDTRAQRECLAARIDPLTHLIAVLRKAGKAD